VEGAICWQWRWYQGSALKQQLLLFGKEYINNFHQTIGHANEQVTRASAHQLGIALRGTFEIVSIVLSARSRRKTFPKPV